MESHPQPQTFTSPARFTLPVPTAAPTPPVALFEQRAYVATTTEVKIIDMSTGEVSGHIEPESAATWGDFDVSPTATLPPVSPDTSTTSLEDMAEAVDSPLLTHIDGQPAVLTAFPVAEDADREVELIAAQADTGEVMWRLRIDLPDAAGGAYLDIAGATGDTAMVNVGHPEAVATTHAVDLTEPALAWSREDTWTMGVFGDTVAATAIAPEDDQRSLVGLTVGEGEQRWSAPRSHTWLTAESAGPWLRVSHEAGSGSTAARLVDIATGSTTHTYDTGIADWMRCRYDGATVIVCSDKGSVLALDSVTGQTRWRIPEGTGEPIAAHMPQAWGGRVTAVADGLIYAEADNGPVVLDARTGATVEDAPGVAPFRVNAYVGLVSSGGEVSVHATTG
ncbi:hypothetical protein GCM10022402_36390 [Salinactinospora qingdaonensis]|uniref:Pyrrolo-quinoline quinone repeat domain-containing protein n=1 Tax=Salinactinospora qingdaonensis TaxID=702744 RepID=A0ABP7G2B5_9ACTN